MKEFSLAIIHNNFTVIISGYWILYYTIMSWRNSDHSLRTKHHSTIIGGLSHQITRGGEGAARTAMLMAAKLFVFNLTADFIADKTTIL